MATILGWATTETTAQIQEFLSGSIRFLYEGGEEIRNRFERILKNICEANRAAYELEFFVGNDLLANDSEMTRLARNAAVEVMRDEQRVTRDVQTMAGEDFAAFANTVPSTFAFIGIFNEKKGCVYLRFTIDEDALGIGAELYVQTSLRFLIG